MKKKINMFLKYIRKPSNEFGFQVCTLHTKFYPKILPSNIYIDDSNSWIKLGDKQIILFQINNNDKSDWNNIIPMSIENESKILVKNSKIELNNSEIEKIKDFVKNHQKELINLANGKMEHSDFFKTINLWYKQDSVKPYKYGGITLRREIL
jgi:hypothetical protein